jgi:hypothetical protein
MNFRCFDPKKKLGTGFIEPGTLREVVNKNIRIYEYLRALLYFMEIQILCLFWQELRLKGYFSEGFKARTFRTMIPGYFSGGYKRILPKSWSRVMMTLFSVNANEAISESGEAEGKISLTSTTLYPSASMIAFVERGIFASIRKFKSALPLFECYFLFLCKNGCIKNTCSDVFIINRRVFGLDLLIGHSGSKRIEDDKDRDTSSLYTGLPVANSRVYGYSLKQHTF